MKLLFLIQVSRWVLELCQDKYQYSLTDHWKQQKNAWEYFSQFEKPFLCVFAGNDRITNGGEKPFLKKVPGTKNQPHVLNIGGGHFFQWTRPKELSEVLINFVKRT